MPVTLTDDEVRVLYKYFTQLFSDPDYDVISVGDIPEDDFLCDALVKLGVKGIIQRDGNIS